ncbi:MAG TPA: hypothetical protein PKM63_22330 [Panacibacter sp.]|nr:hypothetical protein [Panacibacter sp.]HNP47051.1 hypothetical protein [Panacibacter sp.]
MATTSFNLQQCAIVFQKAAIAINERVQANLQGLNIHEIMDLLNKVQELTTKSSTLFAMSVVQLGEEAQGSFDSLEDASTQIDAVIHTVEKVQEVINFAVKLVSTASSIISLDVQGIISNVSGVLTDITSLLQPQENDN